MRLGLIPINLKCEHVESPLSVDTTKPVFSWELKSELPSMVQTGWRIIVSSTKELAESCIGDMWDSGLISASPDDQLGVKYQDNYRYDGMNDNNNGKPLSITTKYWWRLLVRDGRMQMSKWSEIQFFVTGFFRLHDWKARWFDPINGLATHIRNEFSIESDKTIDYATAYVAAMGDRCASFNLTINGKKVGDDVYAPGPTEELRALVRAYDVTNILSTGNNSKNAIGLVYIKKVSFTLSIHYTDGTTQNILSDGSWKFKSNGPFKLVGYNERFFSGRAEEYDARDDFPGWDSSGFNDENWRNYEWIGWWTGPLYMSSQLVGCRIHEELKPINIMVKGDGRYIVDFGRNISGFIRLTAEGPCGTEIKIRYAETFGRKDEGEIYTVNYWRENYNKFTLKGSGIEVYQPTFMYTGFRYVELIGYPGELTSDKITSCYIHSNIINGSDFSCSDEDINKLYSCTKASFLSNLVNFPTDCPGRERRGWTADAFSVIEAQSTMFDVLKFYYKWFDDIKDCQTTSGWIPVELPLSTSTNADVLWPTACILIPWELYLTYGDKEFLRKYYEVMDRFMNYLELMSDENHYFDEDKNVSFGDWIADPMASKGFLATAYYYRCADLISRIAAVLGNEKDHLKYSQLAASIKDSFNNKYLKSENVDSGQELNGEEKYYYENNSQSTNSHALFFNLVPEHLRQKVLDSLLQRIELDGTNTNGFLGIMCILPALADNGCNAATYDFIKNEKLGGWLSMIRDHDLTTLAEDFEIMRTVAVSYNHAFLGGSLASWMFRHLGGIKPLKPGYSEIQIKPYIPSGMKHAETKVHSVRGMIECSWIIRDNDINKSASKIEMTVSIPPNTIATVYVPESNLYNININGQPANENKDGEYIGNSEDGYAKFRLASGCYIIK